MDASIAASFDWRKLVNLLQGTGCQFDLEEKTEVLEMQVQCMIHQHCHSENPLSLKIEYLLNQWHEKTIYHVSKLPKNELIRHLMTFSPEVNFGGIVWALGTDPREGSDCLRRRFHQRIQVVSIRKMMSNETLKVKAG